MCCCSFSWTISSMDAGGSSAGASSPPEAASASAATSAAFASANSSEAEASSAPGSVFTSTAETSGVTAATGDATGAGTGACAMVTSAAPVPCVVSATTAAAGAGGLRFGLAAWTTCSCDKATFCLFSARARWSLVLKFCLCSGVKVRPVSERFFLSISPRRSHTWLTRTLWKPFSRPQAWARSRWEWCSVPAMSMISNMTSWRSHGSN
mmetsp:Transcript_48664/g.146692  ORF Transcript_48664/g.146692 Transcript_48664/m.146692 type:complete len:209 (-) Transcript_48664:812-1438(-)